MHGEKAWAQAPRSRGPTVEGEGPQEVDPAKLTPGVFRTQGRKRWPEEMGVAPGLPGKSPIHCQQIVPNDPLRPAEINEVVLGNRLGIRIDSEASFLHLPHHHQKDMPFEIPDTGLRPSPGQGLPRRDPGFNDSTPPGSGRIGLLFSPN